MERKLGSVARREIGGQLVMERCGYRVALARSGPSGAIEDRRGARRVAS